MRKKVIAITVIILTILGIIYVISGAKNHPVPEFPPTQKTPHESWESVLSNYVNEQGEVDFQGLAINADPLKHYVSYIATTTQSTHPDIFTDPQKKLAHYINCYNALAMYNVINTNYLPKQRLHFFALQNYNIGGEYYSLHEFETFQIRPLNDPRIHFALNCMVRSCPRLLNKPYLAETLDEQLNNAAKDFFNSEAFTKVDDKTKTVTFSKIIKFYAKDFQQVSSTVFEYANQFRMDPIEKNYRIEYMEYDWSLNSIQ